MHRKCSELATKTEKELKRIAHTTGAAAYGRSSYTYRQAQTQEIYLFFIAESDSRSCISHASKFLYLLDGKTGDLGNLCL